MTVAIAPSIIAADPLAMGQAVETVEAGGADCPRRRDGRPVRAEPHARPGGGAGAEQATALPLDVHLMVDAPERYLETFAKAGAAGLTVHVEATRHLHRTCRRSARWRRRGVALNPATPVVGDRGDRRRRRLVLVMSVNPGFSWQTFIPRSDAKIAASARCSPRAAAGPGPGRRRRRRRQHRAPGGRRRRHVRLRGLGVRHAGSRGGGARAPGGRGGRRVTPGAGSHDPTRRSDLALAGPRPLRRNRPDGRRLLRQLLRLVRNRPHRPAADAGRHLPPARGGGPVAAGDRGPCQYAAPCLYDDELVS